MSRQAVHGHRSRDKDDREEITDTKHTHTHPSTHRDHVLGTREEREYTETDKVRQRRETFVVCSKWTRRLLYRNSTWISVISLLKSFHLFKWRPENSYIQRHQGDSQFANVSQQTRLDSRSIARRPIKVGIRRGEGRERAEAWTLLIYVAHRLT